MTNMQIARKEIGKVIARQRLATALRSNVPEAANHDIEIRSDVLLYEERCLDK